MVGSTALGPNSVQPLFFRRCLGVSSVSTVGLLLLLTKRFFADDCGADDKSCKNPAGSIDLLSACSTLPMETALLTEVSVVVASNVACRHPRPLPSTPPTLVLGADNHGVMKLDALRDLAHGPNDQPGHKLAKQWATALGCNHTYSWSITLISCLGKFANNQELLCIRNSCVLSNLVRGVSFERRDCVFKTMLSHGCK